MHSTTERPVAQNLRFEESLLSAVLASPKHYPADGLDADWFVDDRHRELAVCINAAAAKSPEGLLDSAIVLDVASERNRFPELKGTVLRLLSANCVPAHVPHYIAELENCYRERRAMLAASELQKSIGRKPVGELLERFHQSTNGEEIHSHKWPALDPFGYRLPEFPVKVLPDALREFVIESSTQLQTPADMQALFCLSVIASTIARKVSVRIESKSWREPVNLYTCSVLDVGNRKSAACEQCTRPLDKYEVDLIERERAAVAQHNQDIRMMEKRLKAVEEKIARGPTKTITKEKMDELYDEARMLAQSLAETEKRMNPELLADDCTPQALEGSLYGNNARVAFMSPEGGIFDVMAGRWNQGTHDLDVFLKGHAGDNQREAWRQAVEKARAELTVNGKTPDPATVLAKAERDNRRLYESLRRSGP